MRDSSPSQLSLIPQPIAHEHAFELGAMSKRLDALPEIAELVFKDLSLGLKDIKKGRMSLWALSHDWAVGPGLRNAYFAERGLISIRKLLREKLSATAAPKQLELPWG